MSNSEIKKEYKHLFFLDEGKLRKIVDMLTQFASKKDFQYEIYFDVSHSDHSIYKENELQKVLGDENVKGKEITELSICLKKVEKEYSWRNELICQIEFSKSSTPSSYDIPIKYSIIDSDKNWSYGLAEELDIYLKRTIVAKKFEIGNFIKFIDQLLPFVLFGGVLFIIKSYFPIFTSPIGDFSLINVLFGFLVIFPFLLFISVKAFGGEILIIQFLIKSFIEKNSTFYWGDQIEHFNKSKQFKNNIKWVVIIGFLVSSIAGLVVAVLLK